MKQGSLFTKIISSFCLLQFLLSINSYAQVIGSGDGYSGIPPEKHNWIGFAEMTSSESGTTCVVPYAFPAGEGEYDYYFYLRTVVFLADDNLSAYDPLYLYYNLPNGQSNIVPITNTNPDPLLVYVGEITEEIRQEFGEVPPVGYCAMLIFEACMPECTDFEGCGKFSTQLLTHDGNGPFTPYPIGNAEYPIGNGLFPSDIFESDEFGYAFHYTEFKEICCSSDNPYNPNVDDPCSGYGGTVQITQAPNPYPYNPSPCYNHGLGLKANTENVFASLSGQKLEQKNIEAKTILFPNPASSNVIIQYQSDQIGLVRLDCMDAQGRILKSIEINSFQKGMYQETIDVSSWQAGIYFIRVSSSEESQTLRFVKSS